MPEHAELWRTRDEHDKNHPRRKTEQTRAAATPRAVEPVPTLSEAEGTTP